MTQKLIFDKVKFSLFLLTIVYLVGIVGVLLPIHEEFILLTPLNLVFSLVILLWNQEDWSAKNSLALIACGGLGWAIEWLGVSTGFPFGEYYYGATLGFSIADVPLMMAVNWAMMVYSMTIIFSNFSAIKSAALGATFMLFIDLALEPVAVKYDFWQWNELGNNMYFPAPIQNYLAWWILGFALIYLSHFISKPTENKIALPLMVLQFVFFIVLSIFGKAV
jgi:bisanhydrobacterioruberin hydratase